MKLHRRRIPKTVRPLPSCNRAGVQPASWEAPFKQQYQLPALVESKNLSIAEEYEQGRRSKQKKKEVKAKFKLSKDQKAQRRNDVKEETNNLLTTREKSFKLNQWNFFLKKG